MEWTKKSTTNVLRISFHSLILCNFYLCSSPTSRTLIHIRCKGTYFESNVAYENILIDNVQNCSIDNLYNLQVRNATAYFIINLSACDLMFCCFNLPLAASMFWHRKWIHGDMLCGLFPFFRYGNNPFLTQPFSNFFCPDEFFYETNRSMHF